MTVADRLRSLGMDPDRYHLRDIEHDLRDTVPGGGRCSQFLFLAIAHCNEKD